MSYQKYIQWNLPYLRSVTKCTTSLLCSCLKEKVLTEEEKHLIDREEVDQNLIFWNTIINKYRNKWEEKIMTNKRESKMTTKCKGLTKENVTKVTRGEPMLKKLADIFHANDQIDVVQILLKANRDDGKDQKFAFINNVEPLTVKVRQPEEAHQFPENICILPRLFVGLALIINITDYKTSGWKRHGASQDTNYLVELWSDMGYKVLKEEGYFDKDKFEHQISIFLSEVQEVEKYRSYIIYIGGRGDETSIFISDQNRISYSDFVLKFSTLKTETPKLFIIQAVPGWSTPIYHTFDKTLSKVVKTAIICYLREPWTKVKSITNVGSWLLYNFVDVFMREAFRKDLITMLKTIKDNIQCTVGKPHGSLFEYKIFGMKTVHFDLSRTGENMYSRYIARNCAILSEKCKEGNIVKVIADCEKNYILTPNDQKQLVALDLDKETSFWELVIEKSLPLSILIDIFYQQEMFAVVNLLHRATKDDGEKPHIDLENWEPLRVKVIKPEKPMDYYDDDTYCLCQDLIGMALVINVIEYKVGFRRHGAENDGTYMTELWSQMGYKVLKYEGYINKRKFDTILENFINSVNRLSDLNATANMCQSIVVYIGCHGSKDEIHLSDGSTPDFYTDFIFKFEKLDLLNIPKIFVIESCRVYVQKKSYKVKSEITKRLNGMQPMILCFSSKSGKESNRDVFVGSLYTYQFSEVFMQFAHRMELKDLLEKVKNNLEHLFDKAENAQKCHYKNYKMRKLYFNIEP